MSINSVGGSFGYIDPTTVAGPGRMSQAASDPFDVSGSRTASTPDPASSAPSTPTPTPAAPLASGAPKFAPATATGLLKTQEMASTGST